MTEKLVIDRSRWLRGGRGCVFSLLMQPDQKMCCLGFYGLLRGLHSEDMLGVATPNSVNGSRDKWPKWLIRDRNNSSACQLVINANDNPSITDAEREQRLKEAFARHDVEVEFVDDTVTP
jgi:hypothetical protein